MRPTVPENFDSDTTTDRLHLTWKTQLDLLDSTRRSNHTRSVHDQSFPDHLTSTWPMPDHFQIAWLLDLYSTVSDMFRIVMLEADQGQSSW